MDRFESGPFGDGADPAVRRPPVEALAVTTPDNRTGGPVADGQVDGPGRPRHEQDDGGLVSLPDDPKRPVAAFEAQVLDVGGAGLAHPQAVEPEEHGEGGMGVVEAFGREEQCSELGAVETASVAGVDLGSAHALGRVGGDTAVDWAKR